MKVGILVTNNGPHPADKWAEQSAAQIVDVITVEPDSVAFDALTAHKADFETDLKAALTEHHDAVQAHERSSIVEHGMERLDHPMEPEAEHLDAAVAKVQAVADKGLFGSHFRKPEVVEFLRHTLGSHFASVKHIERSWHADKNADAPEAQAFRTKYHPGLSV